ncbi:probable transcription repressor OFP9 [Ananas comosus]|uniref:Transcription repressor n=1 Tax=Ananas comosus TaxID=4615 RepID=A0A199UVD0_ANACO|nr:probable transcription repressor OFP9 [Ananas comosus]OAY68596.1 putative transcription repressor OFP9 [Ananas comosus]
MEIFTLRRKRKKKKKSTKTLPNPTTTTTTTTNPSTRRCRALCCGSRPSVSSSSSSSSSSDSDRALASLAHGVVQARLERLIDEAAAPERGGGRRCVVLIAMDKASYDPRGDFRRSMWEVITAKGMMGEPRELRSLLNCYIAMNARELRRDILEAFHEVCSALFLRSR